MGLKLGIGQRWAVNTNQPRRCPILSTLIYESQLKSSVIDQMWVLGTELGIWIFMERLCVYILRLGEGG